MATAEAGPLPGAAPGTAAERYGEIYDRGYKHYDGPRLGRRQAFWALVRYSAKRAMGIKKSWTAKVIPFLLYLAVGLVALIPIGIEGFLVPRFPNLADVDILPYDDFFGLIYVLEGIFVATIAPEMLCGDRRENVLALYFSRAITRLDYLLAKLVSTALLTLTVSFVPAFVLWFGRQLLADSPVAAMRDNADDLGRVTLAGVAIALYLGAGGLMVSSFTGRKSIAVAVIIVGFLILEALVGTLTAVVDGQVQDYLIFLSPTNTVASFVNALFDAGSTTDGPFDAWVYGAGMAAVVLLCCAVMYLRYVPDE